MNRAENLIQKNQTMTLSTAMNNQAWAAPVFYVNLGDNFYFFSSPNARHIDEALASGQAAGTIYQEGASWQNLLGLQMSGKVLNVSAGVEASKAFLAYIKKFPLVKTIFSDIKDICFNDFSNRIHAKLYRFIPESLLFMDNSIHFGFREDIKKGALFK
jgi:hypothetical protein